MRPEKQLLLDDIRDKITESTGFILTRYGKINPNLASQFRFDLQKTGGDFEIIRKTILMKAAEAAGLKFDRAMLEGHIGVVFSTEDLLQTAKTVFKFKEANEDMIEVIGGRFEGKLCSGQEIEVLAKLPTRPEMQAQLLGLFEAVPSQLLAVFEAFLAQDNKETTKE